MSIARAVRPDPRPGPRPCFGGNRPPRPSGRRRTERGFTYLGLLFAVAISGVMLAATGVLWRTDGAREREAELLFKGAQIQRALESYFLSSPQEPKRFPLKLEELLEDRRGPVVRRHLRQLYPDPFTGKSDWMLVRSPDGRIVGVHSSSTATPIKRASVHGEFAFGDAKSYREWVFKPRNAEQLALANPGRRPDGTPAPPGAMDSGTAPATDSTPLVPLPADPAPAPRDDVLVNPPESPLDSGSMVNPPQ